MLSATAFVSDTLGADYVESHAIKLESLFLASRAHVPLICILSPGTNACIVKRPTETDVHLLCSRAHNPRSYGYTGADPTHQIEELAKKHRVASVGVSMGQGQEIVARKILQSAAADGSWVLLQNAHLGLNYVLEVR